MRVTADARLRPSAGDHHPLRRRFRSVAFQTVEVRARRVAEPRVSSVIEAQVGRVSRRVTPRRQFHITAIVTLGARRGRRKHRGRIAAGNSRVASDACRKELRVRGVRKGDVDGVARRPPHRKSRGRRERETDHEHGATCVRDSPFSRGHRCRPPVAACSALIPGSRPANHSNRTSARR
jgi:hypothetical protein